jgi:hypothetical protein
MSKILSQNGNADDYYTRIPFVPSQRTIIKETYAVNMLEMWTNATTTEIITEFRQTSK